MSITNKEKNLIKKSIVKALIDDKYGIFFKETYSNNYVAVFSRTDLDMVMDRVIVGLNEAQKKLEEGL